MVLIAHSSTLQSITKLFDTDLVNSTFSIICICVKVEVEVLREIFVAEGSIAGRQDPRNGRRPPYIRSWLDLDHSFELFLAKLCINTGKINKIDKIDKINKIDKMPPCWLFKIWTSKRLAKNDNKMSYDWFWIHDLISAQTYIT